MLGLVEYSDSDDEGAREQPTAEAPQPVMPAPAPAARSAPPAPAAPSVALPSADSLFDGTAVAAPLSGSLKRPAGGVGVPQGQPKRPAGSALPRQAGSAGGLLLPPQLRGRSNVSTEDSSVFTAKTQAALRRSKGAG